jgi:transcriptional regulator with XRE-family HTH domain
MNNKAFLQNNPQNIRLEIAGRVRMRRKECKLSQQELAKKSGVSLGSIKRFESTGEISLASLVKIAFALGYEDDFEILFSRRHYNSIQEIIDAQH